MDISARNFMENILTCLLPSVIQFNETSSAKICKCCKHGLYHLLFQAFDNTLIKVFNSMNTLDSEDSVNFNLKVQSTLTDMTSYSTKSFSQRHCTIEISHYL